VKFDQLALTFIALVILRDVAGDLLMLLTGLAVVANFGGLAIASFFAGWFAGTISEVGPSYGQLKGLAALGVITALGLGFLKGVNYLALAVVFILMSYIPFSYVCLLFGAHVAEIGMDVRPRQSKG
jgi:hypothetical protein